MEWFQQKQMKPDELTHPGWDYPADNFPERDKKHGTSDLRVPAVVQPHTDDDTALPSLTTVGELLECLDIVPRKFQMLQGTTRPGSCHIRLGSADPQSNTSTPRLVLSAQHNSSPFLIVNLVEPLSFYPCI